MKSLYFNYKMGTSIKLLRAMLIIIGMFNLILLIPDFFMMSTTSKNISILVLRIFYSIILIGLYLGIKKIKTFKMLGAIVSICEVLGLMLFYYILGKYDNPNFLIQSFGLLIIIIIIFLVPNRLLNMVIVSILGSIGFLMFSYIFVDTIDTMEFWAATVYLIVSILLCSQAARITEIHLYREFIAKNQLEHISSTDHLTQTANRFKLEEEAEKGIDFCRAQGMPLSLVFIDVDDLKLINDYHGHFVGDIVLRGLSLIIQSQLKSTDIVSRWGGDEFALLLPDTSLEDSIILTNKIKTAISEHVFEKDIHVTCSFGISTMKKDSKFESMVREADSLMYSGKKNGKNSIIY